MSASLEKSLADISEHLQQEVIEDVAEWIIKSS